MWQHYSEASKWQLSLNHKIVFCEEPNSRPARRTHAQQLLPERPVRMWVCLLALPPPDRLTPLVLHASGEDSSVSWCSKEGPICSQTPVMWQASHTEATICTNNSHPSAAQCQPYSHPEWARTKGRGLWGPSLSMNSVTGGQRVSEQMSSGRQKGGPTARPSTAPLWSKEARLGHCGSWCSPRNTWQHCFYLFSPPPVFPVLITVVKSFGND